MTGNQLVLVGMLLAMLSGFPALVAGRRSNRSQALSSAILIVGNMLGAIGLVFSCVDGPGPPLRCPSPLGASRLIVAVDPLSAFFLAPVLLITTLASIYGLQYWRQSEHPENGRRVSLFLGLLTGGMILLLIAGDGLVFLTGWEIMALSAFFAVGAEDDLKPTRQAAWLYLAMSHFATLCLFGMFAAMSQATGSFAFASLASVSPALLTAIFALALLGFGTKAGIMPLHAWLPGAHAQAPSHISAVMSGVVIKMGIYGLVRVLSLFAEIPRSWAALTLALGVISAVLGVAFAIGQHDIKRLLAYHSIENIGIIVMGIGLALLGRAYHQPAWVVLGAAGGLLHVWNHALFKSLLFLGAGSVVHATGTRDIELLGGLAKKMPLTANCFLLGAVAICGLPPLNGFVSELLIYLGFFHAIGPDQARGAAAIAAFAAPALALVGALAVACFVKAYGIVFLGAARSERAQHVHESGAKMLGPMAVLAACCVVIGVAPSVVAPILRRAVDAWAGDAAGALAISALAPLNPISILAGILLALLALGMLAMHKACAVPTAPRSPTWDCGYAAPTARMQYTSSSFAKMIVGLFRGVLRPTEHLPKINGLFPANASFQSHVDDVVLKKAIEPATRAIVWLFSWARYLQQGSIHAYLLYMLAIIVTLILWK